MEVRMDNGVNDDIRLRQLIAEAKQRREQQRQRELCEFQQQLEEDLSKDLCALLGLSCNLEQAVSIRWLYSRWAVGHGQSAVPMAL
jgi:hypothetical protein